MENKTKKLPLNEVLRFYRKLNGFTQEELADKLYLSEKTISSYETGNRKVSTDLLEQLSNLYNMDVQDFFNHEKINNDVRKFNIKSVAVTIIGECDNDNNPFYWVEVDVPETGEILEDYSTQTFLSFAEAEIFVTETIEPKYLIDNFHFKDETHIINVIFVSVWDSGYAELKSDAKFNRKENVVFDIEVLDTSDIDLEILDREYILFQDGSEIDVVPSGEEEYYEKELDLGEMIKAIY